MAEQMFFEDPINEIEGYTRHYQAGNHVGSVVFGFEGERDDRHFYLSITAADRAAYVQADTVGELLDVMNDTSALTWLIDNVGYNLNKSSGPEATSADPVDRLSA